MRNFIDSVTPSNALCLGPKYLGSLEEYWSMRVGQDLRLVLGLG